MMTKRIYSKDITPDQRKSLIENFPDIFEKEEINKDEFNLTFENKTKPEIVFHYTSLSTLQNILIRMEAEEKLGNPYSLVLRGTQIEYLNDSTEFEIGSTALTEVIKEHEQSLPESESKKIADRLDNASWKKLATLFNLETLPFITSFSEYNDSLPMWQMYGHNCKGVAIGIEKCRINNSNYNTLSGIPIWCKCEYNKESFKSFLRYHVEPIYKHLNLDEGRWLLNFESRYYISEFLSMLKHNAFAFENEWRLVKPYSAIDTEKNILFFEKDGMVKPYVEHFLHKSLLKKIIIGPCPNQEVVCKTVSMMLERAGFKTGNTMKKVRVIPSQIPYRLM